MNTGSLRETARYRLVLLPEVASHDVYACSVRQISHAPKRAYVSLLRQDAIPNRAQRSMRLLERGHRKCAMSFRRSIASQRELARPAAQLRRAHPAAGPSQERWPLRDWLETLGHAPWRLVIGKGRSRRAQPTNAHCTMQEVHPTLTSVSLADDFEQFDVREGSGRARRRRAFRSRALSEECSAEGKRGRRVCDARRCAPPSEKRCVLCGVRRRRLFIHRARRACVSASTNSSTVATICCISSCRKLAASFKRASSNDCREASEHVARYSSRGWFAFMTGLPGPKVTEPIGFSAQILTYT